MMATGVGRKERRLRRHGTCVILNPASGAATPDEASEIIGAGAEIWTTEKARDGIELARRAVAEGFATVIAAGGDGTLNEVVNGLMPVPPAAAGGADATAADTSDGAAARCEVVCGVLPLGTGNDFARTIGIPLEPAAAWQAIQERRLQSVDVVAFARDRSQHWFINMSVGGAIDQIHDKLTDELKQRWGPLAYLRAGAEALTTLLSEIGPQQVEIRLDGGEPIELEAWSVAIANGRSVGGGIPIAPLADVSDGLLDLVVVTGVRGVELAKLAAAVVLGTHLTQLPDADGPVLFRRARSIEVIASPPMPFTTDGEIQRGSESYFRIEAGALDMIVGARA